MLTCDNNFTEEHIVTTKLRNAAPPSTMPLAKLNSNFKRRAMFWLKTNHREFTTC